MAKSKKASIVKKEGKRVERVRFKYLFADDYNPVYANGCYGGPTTSNEIALHFYVERNPVPHEEIFSLDPNGRMADKMGRVPEFEQGTATVLRYVTAGILMNPEVARRVYEFLGRHLNNMEAQQQARAAVAKISDKAK